MWARHSIQRRGSQVAASTAMAIAAALSLVPMFAKTALADVNHVVSRGHTIDAIAHRYHVTVKAIVDANHLKDPRHLKVGETLVIPGVTPKTHDGKGGAAATLTLAGQKAGSKPVVYAMRPKTPRVVHATRLATNEDFVIRVSSRHGHPAPTALDSFEKMMRSGSGLTHPPDTRLIELIGTVSDHFGSRRLEVISGFRPYTSTQYTAHSNHNIGHAMDFRVVGVPNEVLRDYCRTLKNVGVGYYPNSTFVHLDVRSSSAFWIDYSRPGEPPRYNEANVDADEGTSDVSDDVHGPETGTNPESPQNPLPAIPAPNASPTAPAVSPSVPPATAPTIALPPAPPPSGSSTTQPQ